VKNNKSNFAKLYYSLLYEDLNKNELTLLCELINLCEMMNTVFVTNKYLALKLNISDRTIRRLIYNLKTKNFIETENKTDRHRTIYLTEKTKNLITKENVKYEKIMESFYKK